MAAVNYSFNLQIETGPTVVISGRYEVEAYDRISVKITKKTEQTVGVQPNDNNQLNFIIIESDKYDETGLSYHIVGDPNNRNIALDRGQFLVGKDFVELFPAVPKEINFKNDLDSDVTITILVGRTARVSS
jgi:hypothetical protein